MKKPDSTLRLSQTLCDSVSFSIISLRHQLPALSRWGGLADQIRSLDWRARGAEFICSVSGKLLKDIAAKVSLLLPET